MIACQAAYMCIEHILYNVRYLAPTKAAVKERDRFWIFFSLVIFVESINKIVEAGKTEKP